MAHGGHTGGDLIWSNKSNQSASEHRARSRTRRHDDGASMVSTRSGSGSGRHGGGSGRACVTIELMIHARGLANRAKIGTSDPYARVSVMGEAGREVRGRIGKTEVIDNNLSPVWVQPVCLDYAPQTKTVIEVKIYDHRSHRSTDKIMGSAQFEIGEIVRAKTKLKAKRIQKGGHTEQGWVFVHAEIIPTAVAYSPQILSLMLQGSALLNIERFGGVIDPFYELSRKTENGDWRVVYRSEHVDNDLDPKWKIAHVDLHRLCRGDQTMPVLLSVFDYEGCGIHRPLGTVATTVDGLINASGFGTQPKPLELNHDGEGGYGCIDVKRAYFSVAEDTVHSGRRRDVGDSSTCSAHSRRHGSSRSRQQEYRHAPRRDCLLEDDGSSHSNGESLVDKSTDNDVSQRARSRNDADRSTVHPTIKEINVRRQPPKQQHRHQQRAAPHPKSHNQVLDEARRERKKKESARQRGFTGIFLKIVNAGKLDDEELSPQDSECLRSREAVEAISSSIRQSLPIIDR